MKVSATNRSMHTIKKGAVVMALFSSLISTIGKPAAWSQQPREPVAVRNIHDDFADIGMKVHGFGGMFIDEAKDTLYVYMVPGQPGDVAEVDKAISDVLGSRRPPQHHIAVLQGQYTFLELQDWYSHMRPRVLPMDGVVLTGIDDRNNRLKVGVETSAAASAVQAELDALGIPRQAVNLVRAQVATVEGSLTDRIRPLYGGLNIQRDKTAGPSQCSLGVVAIRQGRAGFVTASHCGDKPFQQMGRVFSQPLKTFPDTTMVGRETVNPPLLTELECGRGPIEVKCSGDVGCRCSDTLFAEVTNGSFADSLGYIARPDLNSTSWASGNNPPPTFKITAKDGSVIVGQSVTKVGATSGRTVGRITDACTDDRLTSDGVQYQLLCVDEADYNSAGGDSGAPVFVITSQDRNEVTFTGIHAGRIPIDGQTFAVYSTIDQIQVGATELGPLIVCADESC
jgi:hypothetical protein